MTTLNKAQYLTLANKGLKSSDESISGFAEACYDDNSFEDLVTGLDAKADATDCKAWSISAEEWKDGIKQALQLAMYHYEDENTCDDIIATDFDHNYHYSEKHDEGLSTEYTRHLIDVYNEINGLSVVYQNGMSFYNNDYSTPSTKVELSADGGTDPKLLKLNELYAEDFENEDYVEHLQELIEELALDDVKTIADLHEVYIDLMDNNSRAQQYADNLDITPVFIDFTSI